MQSRSNAWVMWRMLGLVRPLAGVMVVSVACGVVGHLCATFIPTLAAEGALVALGRGSASLGVGAVCAALAVMAVARGVLHYVEQSCNHYIAFKLLAHIRDLVFGQLRRLAPARLAGADRGSLVSTLTADIELLEVFYAHTISPILIAVIFSVVTVAFMGSLHPAFALVATVAYVCVGVVVPIMTSRRSGDGGRQSRDASAGLTSYVLDSLRGLREVLQYGAGPARLQELDRRSRALVDVQRGLRRVAAKGSAASSALVMAFSVGQLLLGTWLCRMGATTPEGTLLASVCLVSSFGPVSALAALGSTLQPTLAAGNRVLDILDEQPVVAENESGAEVSFTGASAEDVSFSYDGERVLDHVDVRVPAGSIVGITGRSGSGKSTLCRLMMRFWDVDSGSIRVGGTDVREVRTGSLRDAEALVEQDTFLFHDSIRDNLLIAKPDATQEELEAACRAASVHDFIMSLPHGYDTMVGELGDTLSGGERQRLGLARALLHDAPFLLLDEPTSNLDSLNEGAILRSLRERRGSRTVLLVSHRASTMAVADRTYSMDNGRVS